MVLDGPGTAPAPKTNWIEILEAFEGLHWIVVDWPRVGYCQELTLTKYVV